MKERKLIYHVFKVIYSFLFAIVFWPKVYGKKNIPKDGGLIMAGNHKHAFDPVFVMSNTKRMVHFMAKEEVSGGIPGKIYDLVGIIRVYRNRQKNIQSILDAENMIKNGGTLGIFPEGTRNRTDKIIQRFKKGAVTMAQNTNTKILPFAIRGKYKPFGLGRLELEFGKPIDVSNMPVQEANDYLKDEVYKLLTKNQKNN